MQPRIETLKEKKLIGKRTAMSFFDNKTGELWRSFMPRRNEIGNSRGSELYSIEIYEPQFFDDFDPKKEFEKWAAVEVSDFENVPRGMEILTIPNGLYCVFLYKGKAVDAAPFYQKIFAEWIPNSPFQLDDRPHFAVMGAKYNNDSDDSEEELWIPVKTKEKADG